MTESDVAELVSYFLSAFGFGLISAILFRVFRRGANAIR